MLPNGLIVVLDLALEPYPKDTRMYAALVMGMFREDVLLLPGFKNGFYNPNAGHLWPFSRFYCAYHFRKAVKRKREGNVLGGIYTLGRAIHVLIDMACPVHAQNVWHYLDDPFERYVESRANDLVRLPIEELPADDSLNSPEALVTSLARAAQREPADKTQTLWGKILGILGYRKPVRGQAVGEQVHRLIPLAAAHVRAMIQQYESA